MRILLLGMVGTEARGLSVSRPIIPRLRSNTIETRNQRPGPWKPSLAQVRQLLT